MYNLLFIDIYGSKWLLQKQNLSVFQYEFRQEIIIVSLWEGGVTFVNILPQCFIIV